MNLNINNNKETQIVPVKINWLQHSRKIIEIANIFEHNYEVNDSNKNVLKQLLLYFTGNKEFSGDLTKGIMLVGSTGTGKSLLFKIFKYYTMNIIKTNGYQMHTAIDIIDGVNAYGVEYLQLYSHNLDNKIPHPIRCYIDDIASKNETVMNYGTQIKVIEQLLSMRYNIFEKYGTLTHVSSNKLPSQMKELYEERIISRMAEMFNVIELKGNDFRKQ